MGTLALADIARRHSALESLRNIDPATLQALADQIADRICAMYERRGAAGTESVNWAKNARKSPLADGYHDLDTALGAAGRCFNRVLGSLPAADSPATWNHEREVRES